MEFRHQRMKHQSRDQIVKAATYILLTEQYQPANEFSHHRPACRLNPSLSSEISQNLVI
jgi:hypothetical protein